MPWSGPTSGLIHRWPLDLVNFSGGVDSDVVGTINITESGTVTSAVGPTGVADTARSFDGSTGFGTFGSSVLPTSGAYTVSCWAMTPNINANVGTGLALTALNFGTNTTPRLRLAIDNNTANGPAGAFAWSALPTAQRETAGAVFSNNVWSQVAITFDGTSAYQQIFNGVGIDVVGSVFGLPTGGSDILGARTSSASFFFGPLAQLAIYNRILTQAEFIQLYNADASVLAIVTPTHPVGLVEQEF